MLLTPIPLSQTVTLSRTPSPSSVKYFVDGPIDNISMSLETYDISQSALEFFHILWSCPNGHLGQDLSFGGFAFTLMLPKLLNSYLVTVREKLRQSSSSPNGLKI